MSISASCGNCGKTYQAPDRMAGKSVRCKQCGEVFRIDAPSGGVVDLDALESSFGSSDDMATQHASAAGGPSLDEHGRARIGRSQDVQAFDVSAPKSTGPRSNYRFRYPGAKLVDQFLPVILVVLAIALVAQASFNNESIVGEKPTTGVAVSRLIILLAAYLFIVWPASHVALKMASVKMRFSLPSAAVWRSFAAFTPVLMMGGLLFINSEGGGVALAMGLLVGTALAIGAVALLFRVFANEVPTVAAYATAGSLGGAVFSALAIVAINMVAVALARMDKNPTIFVSPIAIGLPWIEKPDGPLVATNHKSVVPVPTVPTVDPTTRKATPTDDPANHVATASPLQQLTIPKPPADEPTLLTELALTPVRAGFDEVLITPVASHALAVARGTGGGVVELWDRTTWRASASAGQGFSFLPGTFAVDSQGKKVFRLVRSPSERLEQIPLGNANVLPPCPMLGVVANRSLVGFLDDKQVLIRSSESGDLALERYDVVDSVPTHDKRQVFRTAGVDSAPMHVDPSPRTLRFLPDDSGVLVAGRDPSAGEAPTLALYSPDNFDKPIALRSFALDSVAPVQPLGMAVRTSSRTALLLESNGEGYLTVWEFRDRLIDGVKMKAATRATLDRKLGPTSSLRPNYWNDAYDPVAWIDEDTLLLYGSDVRDARTGRHLGTLGITNVTAQFSNGDGSVLLVQSQGGLNSLLVAKFDPAALAKARGQ